MLHGVIIDERRESEFYNLPFVLAYAALDQVLAELINQGTFQCAGKTPQLGKKMKASQKVVPWQEYKNIINGKKERNLLAQSRR